MLAQIIVSILVFASVMAMGVLAPWLVAVIGGVLLLLIAINVWFLIISKKSSLWVQIVGAVVAGLVAIGGLFVFRYTGAFNSFLGKVTTKTRELKEYSVLVLEKSDIDRVSELKDKSAGFLKTDLYAGLAEEKLEKTVKVETNTYDDVITMDEMMDDSLLDAMVLETNRIEMLKEEAEQAALFDDKKVIYTFTIELPEDGEPVSQKEITEEPFLVYIAGIDSRNGFQDTCLTDVNILAAVNPKTGKILLASVPRDTYVQLHGTTGMKDKLTHAGWYGLGMSKATLEDLLDVDVDHTIKVSFDAVVKIVDELGGIEIYSDTPMTLGAWSKSEPGKTCTYVEGKQWVDGDCALRFARERKSYYTGDIHRGANQQEVLTAIINKMSSSKDYFLRLPEILDAASDSLETSLMPDDISKFIRLQLAEQIPWQVESIALTGEPDRLPTYSMGENMILYVMHPDENSVKELHDRINEYLEN